MKRQVSLIVASAFVALFFASLLFLSSASVYSKQFESLKPRYANNKILVKLKPEVRPDVEAQVFADQLLPSGGASVESLTGAERGPTYLVHLSGTLSVPQALAEVYKDPRVEYAEPDYFIYPMETLPNDPLFGEMWGLLNDGSGAFGGKPGADIGATRAWDISIGSDDLVVAVIDGGIDLSHPDLAPNAWVNAGEISGNGLDDDGDGFVDDINGWNFFSDNGTVGADPTLGFFYNHGTHVAGTIGAIGNNGIGVAGVAWRVKLMSMKVFGKQPNGNVSGSTSDAVKAINYAIAQKKRGVNLRVINASWAGPDESRSLHDAILAAGNADIVFACASGNGGDDKFGDDMDAASAQFPAAWTDIPSLISVAALDPSDNLASFSNYGHTTVSVGAPGVAIFSTTPEGTYQQLTGTSMSTPHVTGIAALLAAHEPGLTAADIKQRIISTAQPVLSLASKAISSGRANAYNALTNTLPSSGDPAVARVEATRKLITLDGLGFVGGSMVVEVDGAALPVGTKYDDGFLLGNGTFTRIRVKLGKPLMNTTLPLGVPVRITVLNSGTGQRSAPFTFARN